MKQKIDFLLSKSIEYLRNSNLDSAELFLRQALRLQSNNPDVLRLLGVIMAHRSEFSSALNYLNSSLKIFPKNPLTLSSLGNVFLALKDYEKALDAYDKSIKIDPKNAEVWSNKGNLLCELKQYEDALISHEKAVSLNPRYAEGISNRGNIFFELKRYDEAITNYDEALSLKPDYADGWFNRGNVFLELKKYEEAIASYEKALTLKPNHAVGWSDKGNALRELGYYHEADAHYDKALSLQPDYAEGWFNKGNTLWELKSFDESICHYERALQIKPDMEWAQGYLLNVKMEIASWENYLESLDNAFSQIRLGKKIAQPFGFLSLSNDALLHKQTAKIYSLDKYPPNVSLGEIPKRKKAKKIRVGYFSPDFRTHVVAFLTANFFEIHNKDQFEIYAFSLQSAEHGDQMRLRLKNAFDFFIDADKKSDLEIAKLARDLEIDVAVDMGGYTQWSRPGIFACRAAPIQINWFGYAGTLGSNYHDYIVADKIVIPESSQDFYTEKVAYLPDTYMVDDPKRISSDRVFTKQEYNLPDNAFIFCSFNSSYKFNPIVLDSWSRILLRVDVGVLWIPENNEQFRLNIRSEFEKRGIASSRLIFAQRVESMSDHLARYRLADLFLDTFPYSSHSTALDSLKAGVPLISCLGSSFASRVSSSLLNAIGLPELITTSLEEYEELAIKLATNPEILRAIKQKLESNRLTHPLFDSKLFTRNLESLYTKMYERYHDNLKSDSISLSRL